MLQNVIGHIRIDTPIEQMIVWAVIALGLIIAFNFCWNKWFAPSLIRRSAKNLKPTISYKTFETKTRSVTLSDGFDELLRNLDYQMATSRQKESPKCRK